MVQKHQNAILIFIVKGLQRRRLFCHTQSYYWYQLKFSVELVAVTLILVTCDKPVSYTHLDVYKRQIGCLTYNLKSGLQL